MENELVPIDRILCSCREEEPPKTRFDRARNAVQILLLGIAIAGVAALACVGALNIILDELIRLP